MNTVKYYAITLSEPANVHIELTMVSRRLQRNNHMKQYVAGTIKRHLNPHTKLIQNQKHKVETQFSKSGIVHNSSYWALRVSYRRP